ncbi:mucin-2 [Atheta coriaria]|uniref:mucin-2 n=1 Tax=Dalotia coriaria TaxID=877792 RepID=UPI0031F3B0C1
MQVLTLTLFILAVASTTDAQFWKYSQQLFNPFAWIRQGKTGDVTNVSLQPQQSKSTLPATTLNTNPPATKTPIPLPLSYPQPSPSPSPSPSSPVVIISTSSTEQPKPTSEEIIKSEKLESKMDEIDLGPNPNPGLVKVTAPPITTTNAKSPRTTLSERSSAGITASTTKRALKIKSTTSSLYSHSPYVSNSLPTRHQSYQSSSPVWTTVPITTHNQKGATLQQQGQQGHHSVVMSSGTTAALRPSSTATVTEAATPTTFYDTTTQEATGTTEEPRDNHRQHDFYLSKREKPQVKIATNISQNLLPLPAGASAALVKPTKYHYYPHNQHIYLLPECAIQQVCNAVYVRLNWTQPLCACPSRYRDPCSASLNSDDQHTTELQVDRNSKRALTLVKTCEPTTDMRICRLPRDWSLLALQNIRTGKSHYLVICRCPDTSVLEGPMSHDQPTYASVPGIRVYGMMCVQPPQQSSPNKRRGRPLRLTRSIDADPPFPWAKAVEFAKTADWDD